MRQRTAMIGGAVVAAVCLAGCSTSPAGSRTTTTVPPTSTTETPATGAPPTSTSLAPPTTAVTTGQPTTTAPARPAWSVSTVATLALQGSPVLPAGSADAYALVTGGSKGNDLRLTEVPLDGAATTAGPAVPAGSFLVADGGGLDVASPAALAHDGAAIGPWSLRSVSTSTLALGRAVPIGQLGFDGYATSGTIAAQPAGPDAGDLWAAGAGRLELVDPSTGAVVHDVALPSGQGYSVAVEPDGRYVDVSLLTDFPTAGEVLELDTSTAAVVARHAHVFAVGTPTLTAAQGGLWISYRTGMDGTSFHVTEPRLTDDTPSPSTPPSETEPVPGASLGMGEMAYDVGTAVLLTNVFGVACIAASGTRPLSTVPFPGGTWSSAGRSWSPFGAVGDEVYAVEFPADGETLQSIVSVALPAGC